MVTAYFLASGIKAFYNRDPARSQKMMRARVGAQFATLLTFVVYAGMSNFDFRIAPMYQDAKKARQEQKQQEEGK
jgi:Hypoxia induced protein conserved region